MILTNGLSINQSFTDFFFSKKWFGFVNVFPFGVVLILFLSTLKFSRLNLLLINIFLNLFFFWRFGFDFLHVYLSWKFFGINLIKVIIMITNKLLNFCSTIRMMIVLAKSFVTTLIFVSVVLVATAFFAFFTFFLTFFSISFKIFRMNLMKLIFTFFYGFAFSCEEPI